MTFLSNAGVAGVPLNASKFAVSSSQVQYELPRELTDDAVEVTRVQLN